ncbi:MAG: Trk system potassium transporter TrkA [Clostridiales bacterium]|jgi:trk system potassium uptake protein TrkA|nr:Trk system potassium transporter TrkA [Clostridiales bacterium]
MNAVVVGCGKVGYAIAKYLSQDRANNVVVVDRKDVQPRIEESADVMFVRGNGLTRSALSEANIKSCDLFIAATNIDETNVLSCITAERLGAKHSVARVRDPEFSKELEEVGKALGVDMIINPDLQAALEISRLLRFPSATDIETFVSGRVEMVSFRAAPNNPLVGMSLGESFRSVRIPVLMALVERNGSVIVPNGQTVVEPGDMVRVMGKPSNISDFFRYIGMPATRAKDAIIIGGGRITRYLAAALPGGVSVKIIEKDIDRAERLSEAVPEALVIHGDGADDELLDSEGAGSADAVICLTDRDEENIVAGLYAKRSGAKKVILKINHVSQTLANGLDIGSVICPKTLTAFMILRYARGLMGSASGSSMKTLYRVAENGDEFVEAIEFEVSSDFPGLGREVRDMGIKPGVLLGCVVRHGSIIIPTGNTVIKKNDSVIVLANNIHLTALADILGGEGAGAR